MFLSLPVFELIEVFQIVDNLKNLNCSLKWTTFSWAQMESKLLWKWKLLRNLEASTGLIQQRANCNYCAQLFLPYCSLPELWASLSVHSHWTLAGLLCVRWKNLTHTCQVWFININTNFISFLSYQSVNLLEKLPRSAPEASSAQIPAVQYYGCSHSTPVKIGTACISVCIEFEALSMVTKRWYAFKHDQYLLLA